MKPYETQQWLTQEFRSGKQTQPLQGKMARSCKGIKIYVYLKTLVAGSDITVTLWGVNAPKSKGNDFGNAFSVLAHKFTSATTTPFVMTVYPAVTVVADQAISDVLPNSYYLEVTSGNTALNEYSICYDLIP